MNNQATNEPPRWRAKKNEGYWLITNYMNVAREWDWGINKSRFKSCDEQRHESGNYFFDKEEAVRYASFFRNILKSRRCAERVGPNREFYYVDTTIPRSARGIEWNDRTQEGDPGTSFYECGNYFLTEEEADKFCRLFVNALQNRWLDVGNYSQIRIY